GVDADRENDGHCDGSDNGGGENARGRDVGPAMLADPSVPSETRAVDVTAAANGVSNELAETTTADHRNSDESKTRPLSDESSLADPTSDARTRDSALHADDFNIRRQIIPPAPSLIVEVDSSSNDRLTAASASGGEQEAHEDDVVVPSLNQKHELIPDVGRPHNQQEAAGQISRKQVLSASVLSTVTSVSSSIVSSTVGIVVPDVPAVGSMTTTPSLGLSGSLPVGSDMSVKTSNISGAVGKDNFQYPAATPSSPSYAGGGRGRGREPRNERAESGATGVAEHSGEHGGYHPGVTPSSPTVGTLQVWPSETDSLQGADGQEWQVGDGMIPHHPV
ncbi:unnamed protein product, partial [Sphacelaria rigidula]